MTFSYTHADTDVESIVVYEVYYNNDTKALAVVLDSGYGYFYENVDKSIFDRIVGGESAGRIYNKEIKGKHRGGTLGYVGYDSDVFQAAPLPNAPVGVTVLGAKGTPKGLTDAPGAVISNTTTTATLAIPRRHTVIFTVDGGNVTKTYRVNATSVDRAVAELKTAAESLGLEVKVKEVVVSFE